MAYSTLELSTENGNPIELYLFTYNNVNYAYTSSQYYQTVSVSTGSSQIVFNPEYIKRGDNLVLGDSGGNVETCTITLLRTNSVALLYQGSPPEAGKVRVEVFRKHGENNSDVIKIIDGSVSQVTFRDSEAELTITIEDVLNRYIPRGTLSYLCQNCIYDERCTLNAFNYQLDCILDGAMNGLWLYSKDLLKVEDGYITDGIMRMGNCLRTVKLHKGEGILIKYPIPLSERSLNFTVYPGCNGLFTECAKKFNNTDNFSGIPYIQPYDAFTHPVDKGAYWIDGNIVIRDTHGSIGVMT